MIERLYDEEVTKKTEGQAAHAKMKVKKEFADMLLDKRELTTNIEKYLCYTFENQRFFNTDH